MIGLLWYFRHPLVILLGIGIALSYVWPQPAREQFAAQVSHDMCAPPHVCPTSPPAGVAPALLQVLSGIAPAGPGVTYSGAQLEQALQGAGVGEPGAHTGAAVALAESGGRSDAVHLCPPSCAPGQAPERSYGPWQINVLAHPGVSAACAMALACAAVAAAAISDQGRNWGPWSMYGSGAWRAFA